MIDVSWNKTSRSNQFKFGDVFATLYSPQYYGYQSREEDIQHNVSGISKIQDNVDFWEGLQKNVWSYSDLWPSTDAAEQYPASSKQESLMVNTGIPVYWGSDIFNNDYCLVKDVDSLKTIPFAPQSKGVTQSQETIVCKITGSNIEKSIFEKRYDSPGILYFRNSITNKVHLATEALSAVFFKYPSLVREEINSTIKYFAIYGNTFVLETSNYVIVDNLNYDYDTNKITLINQSSLFLKKWKLNSKLEYFAGEWMSEEDNKMYLCFLKLDPLNSNNNFKALYPLIYQIDIKTLDSKIICPDPDTFSVSTYSLCAGNNTPFIDLKHLDGISFEYLKTSNLFNLTYLGKNLNSLPFVVNQQLIQKDPFFVAFTPQLFQPLYYLVDNNYSTPDLSPFVKYTGSTTGIIGSHLFANGDFLTSTFNLSGINYLYCNGVKPLQINTIGTFKAYFDWQSYNEITIFLGCSGITLKNTGATLIWNAFTPQAVLLEKEKPYSITVQKNNIAVNVEILRYIDDSIKFTLTSNTPGFTGLLCDEYESVFKEIAITKIGPGEGRVISDPLCIDCNQKCSEFFGLNTTVVFIASADYWSNFIKWVGGPCDNTSTDCIINVVSALNFQAYFEKIPTRFITVTTPAGRVYSQDLRIDAIANDGSQGPTTVTVEYPVGRFITLSATTPLSGWVMYGNDGGGSNGIVGDRCTFGVIENATIFARYIRYFEYPLRVLVTSFVNWQSAAADYIAVGGNNVDDGLASLDPYFYRYNCNSSCTFMFTGTNTSRYGNQTVTISAKPSPGRRLKYWLGDLDCNQEEYALKSTITPYASVVIAEPTDIVNTGYVCNLQMDRPREVTGVFDVGYYTLTVIASGDGLGVTFAYPEVFNNLPVPPVFYYKENIEPGEILKFAVLSGTTITVRCTATKGSSFIDLSSMYCAPVYGVSACTFKMDRDITVITTISGVEWYTLNVLNLATCGVGITAVPAGRYGVRINCGLGCAAEYPSNRRVSIRPVSAGPSCDIDYFMTDDIVGGGLQAQYVPGPGIVLSVMDKPADKGETLSLVDPSIVLTTGGIPYKSGTGIDRKSVV